MIHIKDCQVGDNGVDAFDSSNWEIAFPLNLRLPVFVNMCLDDQNFGLLWIRNEVLQASAFVFIVDVGHIP